MRQGGHINTYHVLFVNAAQLDADVVARAYDLNLVLVNEHFRNLNNNLWPVMDWFMRVC